MKFKEFLVWLLIFIIGSLIVNFIIEPSSVNNIIDKVENTKDNIKPKKEIINYIEILVPKSLLSCSMIEIMAESNGMSIKSSKEKVCKIYCGQENLNYGKFNCDRDQLICYCIK